MERTKLNTQTKAQPIEGRTSLYNPLLQKPVALEPVGPGSYPAGLGGYAYIGPPADFGGTYGCYEDTVGRKQFGIKGSKQFSIYDGSPVALKSELSVDEREALLTQMDEIYSEHKCEACRAELMLSAPIQLDKVYCPYCSSEMMGAVEKLKQCYSKLEEKNMNKEKVQEKVQEKIQAEADLAKEAMKVEAPKELNEAVPTPKAAEMHEPTAVEKESTMLKETDCGLEKQPSKAAVEAKAKTEAAAKRRERLEAAKKAYEAKKKEKALASLRQRKAVQAQIQKNEELKKELRIMATLEPAKFAEIKKNPKLSAICAEVESKLYSKEERKQARAELKVLAEHDHEAAEKAKKDLEFVAPEILLEKDEEMMMMPEHKEEHKAEHAMEHEKHAEHAMKPEKHEMPAAPVKAEEKKEEHKEEKKEEHKPGEEKKEEMAEAAKVEYLAAMTSLKGEKVEMSLYGEDTENPFWNVTIDAEPVGRIYLQDQENHEQIRAGFTADNYGQNFAQAMQQVGIEKMLTLGKARLFAHQADKTEPMARVKAAAKAEAAAEFSEKMQTLRQDFIGAMQVAVAAADKNMYQGKEDAHALKGGLYNALASIDVSHDHAIWAIESGFELAPEYFNFITQKAIEIMDMPKEARDSFENIVKASGKMELADMQKPEEESLRDRLVKASQMAVASGGFVGGEDKDEVRANLKLSPYRK